MKKILNLFVLFLSLGLFVTSCTQEDLTTYDALVAEDTDLEDRDGISIKIKKPIYQALRLDLGTEERLRFTNKFVDRGGYARIYNLVGSKNLSYERDLINLKRIDANRNTEEDDKFVIVDQFTGTAGQLTVDIFPGTGYNSRPSMDIKGDVTGNGVADFHIDVSDFAGVQNLLQDRPRIKL